MPSPAAKISRRALHWLGPAALLALAPKCLLCVLAYAGLGAALGLGGPEFCRASAMPTASWALGLAWLGLLGSVGALGVLVHRRSGRSNERDDLLTTPK